MGLSLHGLEGEIAVHAGEFAAVAGASPGLWRGDIPVVSALVILDEAAVLVIFPPIDEVFVLVPVKAG